MYAKKQKKGVLIMNKDLPNIMPTISTKETECRIVLNDSDVDIKQSSTAIRRTLIKENK